MSLKQQHPTLPNPEVGGVGSASAMEKLLEAQQQQLDDITSESSFLEFLRNEQNCLAGGPIRTKMVYKLVIFVILGAFAGKSLANECTTAGVVDGFIPHPTNCSMYISCYVGVPYEISCPAGYYFNPDLKKCDHTYVCLEVDCPPTGVVVLPVNGSCTDFVWCIGGQPFPESCEEGLSFDPETLKCIPAAEAACVENQCDPTIPPPQFFADPFDCTLFYICDEKFQPVQFQCANGTVFDESVHDCVIGDTCPETTEPTTTTIATDTTSTEAGTTTTEEPTTTTEEPQFKI